MATETHTEVQAHGGEAEGAGFPPFDGSTFPSQILWLAITFGLFYHLMKNVALPRIAGILEDRRDRIAGDLAEADRLKHETDAAIAAYEQALAEARDNANGIARATRDKLNAEVETKRHAAEEALKEKLVAAEERIAGIKAQALSEIGTIATDTAGEVVTSLIGGKISKKDLDEAVSGSLGS